LCRWQGVADVRPIRQWLTVIANQLYQRLMLLKLVSLYNRGRAVAPDRARPRSRPHPPIPPEVGAHYPPSILSEALRSGYMLQACGSTLSSAMTPALSFVMTRASSWLGPVQFCVAQIPALARIPIMLKAKWASPSLSPPIQHQRQHHANTTLGRTLPWPSPKPA